MCCRKLLFRLGGSVSTWQMAAELLYWQEWQQHDGDLGRSFLVLHQLLYEHFGDVLCVATACGLPHRAAEESRATPTSADVPVFSLAKHPVTNVHELDYMNWTAIAPMPSNLATLLRTGGAGGTYVASRKRKPSSVRHLTIDTAFDMPVCKKPAPDVIRFSFAGSKPVGVAELRRRVPDPLQARFRRHSVYHEHSCRLRCIGKLGSKPCSRILSVRVPHILAVI